MEIIRLSQILLLGERNKQPTIVIQQQIAHLALGDLRENLTTDDKKKTFWINIYNAYAYRAAIQMPQLLLTRKGRKIFFSKRDIIVAGVKVSLDDIAHGILRRSKNKYMMGYFQKFKISAFEREFRVTIFDHRIHFALNFGSQSCPPLYFYEDNIIHEQLQEAMYTFLKNDSEFIKEKQLLFVSGMLLRYYADFGGKPGILSMLIKSCAMPIGQKPKIIFKRFKWELEQ